MCSAPVGRRSEANAHGDQDATLAPRRCSSAPTSPPPAAWPRPSSAASSAAARAIQIFNQTPRMWRPTIYTRRGGRRLPRGDGRPRPIDALLIHAVYLLNCAERRPGDPREVADLADRLAAGRRRARRARASCCTPARRKTGDVGEAIAARRRGHPRGAGRDRPLPAAPREHRRRRRHARALLRGARGADRGGAAATSGSASASTPATCSRRGYDIRTAAGAGGDARRLRRAASGSTGSARCTSTTRRRRSAPTATATPTSARASSARTGCARVPLRAALRGPAARAGDARPDKKERCGPECGSASGCATRDSPRSAAERRAGMRADRGRQGRGPGLAVDR